MQRLMGWVILGIFLLSPVVALAQHQCLALEPFIDIIEGGGVNIPGGRFLAAAFADWRVPGEYAMGGKGTLIDPLFGSGTAVLMDFVNPSQAFGGNPLVILRGTVNGPWNLIAIGGAVPFTQEGGPGDVLALIPCPAPTIAASRAQAMRTDGRRAAGDPQ